MPATPFFLSTARGQRFCLLYERHFPNEASRGLVVVVPPFAEELNRTRRMVSLQCRVMAQAGFDVLQLDLGGCGDSTGQFAEASWEGWVADVLAAKGWLQQHYASQAAGTRHPVQAAQPPLWLWGVRAGCLLAAEVARRSPETAANLLFWQPPTSGAQHLAQFLRLRMATDLVRGAGETKTANPVNEPGGMRHAESGESVPVRAAIDGTPGRTVGPTAKQMLENGETVEVGGYAVPPALANGLAAAHLNDLPAGAQVVAFEFVTIADAHHSAAHTPALSPSKSPALTQQVARWQQQGVEAACQAVAGQPFWQSQEIEVVPGVFDKVVDALTTNLGARSAQVVEVQDITNTAVAPSVVETALNIACGADQMVGIVSMPPEGITTQSTGVVIVVGGPQYRVGSHRQFVLLAWQLAAAGFAVMRFDYRGMGDSEGEPRDFEAVSDDIAAAAVALQNQCPAVQRMVLFGLCDGASASLLYVGQRSFAPNADGQKSGAKNASLQQPGNPSVSTTAQAAGLPVAGLCLLNPWVRSDASLARTHLKHHYTQRLRQGDFWRKLVSGDFNWRQSVADLWANWRKTRDGARSDSLGEPVSAIVDEPFQQQMAWAFLAFDGPMLLVLSGDDYTAKEFLDCAQADPDWRGALQRPGLQRLDMPGADHTFSRAAWRAELEQSIVSWMKQLTIER